MKALILIFLLTGCVKPDENMITIRAGHHRAILSPLPHVGNEIRFTFTTNKTWLQEGDGVNKICGFSFGSVHENSARLGWQFDGETLTAYAYTYVNGVRFYEAFSTLQVNQTYNCQIIKEGELYHFRLNDSEYKCPADGWLPGDILYPYIGGEGTFSKDFTINLQINVF